MYQFEYILYTTKAPGLRHAKIYTDHELEESISILHDVYDLVEVVEHYPELGPYMHRFVLPNVDFVKAIYVEEKSLMPVLTNSDYDVQAYLHEFMSVHNLTDVSYQYTLITNQWGVVYISGFDVEGNSVIFAYIHRMYPGFSGYIERH